MDDRKKKRAYWATTGAAFMAIASLLAAGLAAAGWLVSGTLRWAATYWPFVLLSAVGPSRLLAARLCRKWGLSLERRTVETIERDSAVGTPVTGERVLLSTPPEAWAVPGVAALIGAVLFCVGAAFLPAQPGTEAAGYALAGFFVLLAGLSGLGGLHAVRFRTEVGDEGITKRSLLKRRRRQVSWAEIAACSVETERNAHGGQTAVCSLRGPDGKELLRLDLSPLLAQDHKRFLVVLRGRGVAAPAELVAAQAPAGLGTELQAGEAPVGRGTELESAAADGVPPASEPERQRAQRPRA